MEMAKADNAYKSNEDQLLREIAERMQIDLEDVASMDESDQENARLHIPKSEMERMTIFYQLLFMMRIDGNVSQGEKKLCQRMGFRLGINPLLVEELIDIMVKHLNDRVPEEEMLRSIKKYLN